MEIYHARCFPTAHKQEPVLVLIKQEQKHRSKQELVHYSSYDR